MFSVLPRAAGSALRQTRLLFARTEPRMALQLRFAASATLRLLEDCLGEFNNSPAPFSAHQLP